MQCSGRLASNSSSVSTRPGLYSLQYQCLNSDYLAPIWAPYYHCECLLKFSDILFSSLFMTSVKSSLLALCGVGLLFVDDRVITEVILASVRFIEVLLTSLRFYCELLNSVWGACMPWLTFYLCMLCMECLFLYSGVYT